MQFLFFAPTFFLCAWQFSVSGFICVVEHSHFFFYCTGIFVHKLWEEKNCSSDREKCLKFEAEDWEFAIFETELFFNLLLEAPQVPRTKAWEKILIQIGKTHWDLETYK